MNLTDVKESARKEDLQRLFHQALERDETGRRMLLAEASSSDKELSALAEDLVRASQEARGFLAEEDEDSSVWDTVEARALDQEFEPLLERFLDPGGAPREGEMLGDYEVLEKLGGNMGLVFRARHRLLGKVVALKVLPADRGADPDVLARFERELKVMGQLEHPNLVTASDARVEGRWRLVAMELIEGTDLGRLVLKRGPLPVAAACEVARQACLGLEHARRHGLVHRDIKPSNLMLSPEGVVKVIDMGLALVKGEAGPALTQAGVVMGTMSYCAPEQFKDASKVDIRADIYGLGCTLFHLLAGEPPYGKRTAIPELMRAHLEEPFPKVSERRGDVPVGLEKVLARMTAKDPAKRHVTPAEAAEALGPFADGAALKSLLAEEGEGATASAASTPMPRQRRWPRALLLAAAALLALGLGWIAFGPGSGPESGQGGAIQVTTLLVEHFDNRSGKAVSRGRMGEKSFAADVDDDVRVSLTLSEPGYFYLLALNPDGKVQLCWPESAEAPPGKRDSLRFPDRGTQGFGLTDGEGLQGFLVAASARPLPAYSTWREEVEALPWTRTTAEGVWSFAGGKLDPEGEDGAITRGKVRDLRGLSPFSKVCEELSARPEFASVRAIAFPVEGKK
jgi:hypothetical protein